MKKLLLFLVASLMCGCNANQSPVWNTANFTKPPENPILGRDSTFTFFCPMKKDTVHWQKADVFNPAAIVRDGKMYLLYRCEDNPRAVLGGRTSRIGLTVSDDGIHFRKELGTPVLYPDSDAFAQYDNPGGCEDPVIAQTEDGLYVLMYQSWNLKIARLSVAFSRDLVHWEKKGPVFAKAYDGKFRDTWTKCGAIITKMAGDRQVIAKINGKYWMYWGEQNIGLAWSDNLSDWNPILDEKGELKKLVTPRPGKFDSELAACGPPALITERGIKLIYTGMNAINENADPRLPKGIYTVGQVTFDVNNLEKVIDRTDDCFLKPTLPHEITGQYQAGTMFVTGIAYFQKKWFMYYGTADSYVGVAISQ
jgi:beta-1,2-mannosidase